MHIYKITNLINNKIYIGQTTQKNPKMRWYGHLAYARDGRKSHLYDSIRKYGENMFAWEIIDQCSSLEELNDKEQYWLNHYRNLTEVYNAREAGGNKTHSVESIEKMRAAQKAAHARRRGQGIEGGWKRVDGGAMKGKAHPKKGKASKKWSETQKEKLSMAKRGKKVGPMAVSHKENIRDSMKKRYTSEEQRQKTSAAVKQWWAQRKQKASS